MADQRDQSVDPTNLAELEEEAQTETYVDPEPVTSVKALRDEGLAPPSLQQRVLSAVERVRTELPADASKEVQEDVAEILHLLEPLQSSLRRAATRVAIAELALDRLLREPPDTVLVKRLIKNLRKTLGGRIGLWFSRLRTATPPHVDVVLGLVVAVVLLAVALVVWGGNPVDALGVDVTGSGAAAQDQSGNGDRFFAALIWLGAVGAFGGVISILTRINTFAEKEEEHALLFFMNGLFKPVIGLAAADLAYVLIRSQLVPLNFDAQYATYAFMGIAFAAGFSERLINDLVSVAERSVVAAGERGVEAQKVAQEQKAADAREEITRALAGSTEVPRDQIYGSVDLDDLEETVEPERTEGAEPPRGAPESAPPPTNPN